LSFHPQEKKLKNRKHFRGSTTLQLEFLYMLAVLLGELLVSEIVNKRMISFLGVRGETGTETETELLAGLENIINPNSKEKFRWEACWS
jgi:hypothetical protein